MIPAIVACLVGAARRHAAAFVCGFLLAAAAAGWYAAGHLAINTDIERMLPNDLPWRQREIALDKAFPQNNNLLAIVVDGATPELADQAAAALAKRLGDEPRLFHDVRRPDGGSFFEKSGLLFLSREDVQKTAQQLIDAQPLLGGLAHDPSLRGLFDALALFVRGAARGDVKPEKVDPALTTIGGILADVLAGRPAHLSWQRMITGKAPEPRDLRRFVLTRPALDFTALEPGGRARAEVRHLARTLGLTPAAGVRVRMTGPVALDDQQFSDLKNGALGSTLLSLALVCAILFLALRSAKLVGAILLTLAVGLVLTAAFAAAAIGSLNLISIAFAVLFVGLATDFAIQFSIRYRDHRHRHGDFALALESAAGSIARALVLAAGATAIGFFAFLPTHYIGISELGLIAGAGMVIGITLTFLLLPALLALLRPQGEPEPIGFRRAAGLDRFLLVHRRRTILLAAVVGAVGLALLPRLSFDFDPLDLNNPKSEAVSTLYSMMRDPTTSPYPAEILTPSIAAAGRLAVRLGKLPQVAQAVSVSSYVPEHQKEKLAAISDMSLLLGPTLTPIARLPPPSTAEVLQSIGKCRGALDRLAAKQGPKSPSAQLAAGLGRVLEKGAAIVPPLQAALIASLPRELDLLRQMLEAQPVTEKSLSADLERTWVTPDGRARVEVFPRGNPRDQAVLRRFVDAVRTLAPEATGPAVTIQEAGALISGAFIEAGLIAVVAITVLLGIVLRRLRDVVLVIAPLALAAILTLATTVVIGMPLNYANIVALPLLLGIGVAFDIYFVVNWRMGTSAHLQSSTARAVVFSALTTLSAFGSLALSSDPGMSAMGALLSISLAATLLCTLFVLPALLGPAPQAEAAAVQERQAARLP
ncbi:MAG TPA: MMPL family transporter [Stellaceae bacterium]|nr:MMPL family transporter [Stellaceae bacterium]